MLLVVPPDHPWLAALAARLPDVVREHATAATLPAQRYDVALVAGVLEALTPAAARELLAALRDRVAPHVLVWLDVARGPVDEATLRALGYRVLARDGPHVLGGFDLYDYKDRPDWLNARYWAHPERWDKHRW